MSDVFREVDEAVRQDQLKQVWKRYGWLIVTVVLAIILGFGGYHAWNAHKQSARVEASDSYAAALQQARDGKVAEALEGLEALADPASGEVGTLAAFAQARILAGQGQQDAALRIWDALAASDAAGPSFKAAAVMLAVQHQIGQADPAALEARLQPYLAEGQPFRATASELSALLALEQGDTARARELLTGLTTAGDAPSSQRARVAQLLQAIGE